jgi:acetyl-CoA acetyltransferase
MDEIVILSGARTAIGTFGGALAGVPPITLGATAAKAALERAGVEGGRSATSPMATSSTPNRVTCISAASPRWRPASPTPPPR